MALTGDQYRSLIVAELNGGANLLQNINVLWELNERYASTPVVRYLRTKQGAIDFLLGQLDEQLSYPIEGDLDARLTNRRIILLALRSKIDDLIARIGSGAAGPVVSTLTTTTIIPSPNIVYGVGDANDTYYTGDPNVRPLPVMPT